ncbi:GNAT family N-acetyltransferase [Pseudonocardia sp.]|uniref:GNAT family N-acetyltransferase n=1 Tax=Pseudonocardia sp. TaxID=60912 RepID=UPI00260552EF|nr:GNAT family N-acetyltransferase [Pseudonocardia sp.]
MHGLEDVDGRRASVRYRIGDRHGRPLYTDAVGELTVDGDTVTVDTRRGTVRIARATVVAVRAVPPAPPRRASWAAVVHIEELCADAWPALVDTRLGAWRMRAAGGYTARANGTLALGDPGVALPVALDAVRTFAAANTIPPRVTVAAGSRWDTAVSREGWVLDVDHAAGPEAVVLVSGLADLARPVPPSITLPEEPDPDWWSLGLRGPAARSGAPGWDGPSPAVPTAVQRHVLRPPARTAFALARDPSGTAVGQVRATIVEDHLHLSWLTVVPAARRAGLATALVASAATWARGLGARFGVLQVAEHNGPARALYARTGWTEHHRYRHLVPPR